MKRQKIFLLGGYDLEMLTIRQMLEKHDDCIICDKHLHWDDAKVSSYKEEMKKYEGEDIYGVELTEDIETPVNYHRIDHHNDKANEPSALEQVAEMLDVELNRYELLVAANDKGYIPAMQALCPSSEEIDEIRRKDREAQGVTPEDEAMADKAIKENMSRYGDLIIVKALGKKFSPICDKLYPYKNLFIYTENEWMFYGEGVKFYRGDFVQEIEDGKVFYGGGEQGYMGAVENAFSKKQIEEILHQLKLRYEPTYSYHIFMFPFSLKSDRVGQEENWGKWKRANFEYDKGDFASNFSEQGYFYDFCSGAMFDEDEKNSEKDEKYTEKNVINTYRYPTCPESTYTININKYGKKRSYELNIEKIELNIYDDKAGVMMFYLRNKQYSDVQDILYINDYGRRIYPQFLVNDIKGNINLKVTKNTFLADSICLKLNSTTKYEEDFSSYSEKNVPPYTLPIYIRELLPVSMRSCRWLLDDRMYVVSYFANVDFSDRMKRQYGSQGRWLDRERVEWLWYQYVFIDNDDPTCQNEDMFKRLLTESTYTRWSGYGTFYGVSRYSFTVLIGNDGIGLLRHIKTIYCRMASLVLAQRVMSLHYSKRIFEISKELDKDKNRNELSAKEYKGLVRNVSILNKDYLRFVNNIYFREVTPQDQGIELYDMMQEQMNVKRDEEGLSREIEQLYHYVSMANDEQRNEKTEKLSNIAAVVAGAALIVGIWSMNLECEDKIGYIVLTIIAIIGAGGLYYYYKK